MDPDFRIMASLAPFVNLSHCGVLAISSTKKGIAQPDVDPLITKVENGATWLDKIRTHFDTYKTNTGKILANGKAKVSQYQQVDKKEFTTSLFKLSDDLIGIQTKIHEERCLFLKKVHDELNANRFSLVDPFLSIVSEHKDVMVESLTKGENLLFETLNSLLVPTKKQLRESIERGFAKAQKEWQQSIGIISENVLPKMNSSLEERITVLACEIKNANGRLIVEKSEQGLVVRTDIPLDAFPNEKSEILIGTGEEKLRCVIAKKENQLKVKLVPLPSIRNEDKRTLSQNFSQETEKSNALKAENNPLVKDILALLNSEANECNLYQILTLLSDSPSDRSQKKEIYLILIRLVKNSAVPNKDYLLYLILKNAVNDPKLHYYSVLRIRSYLNGHCGQDFIFSTECAGPASELLKKYKTLSFSKCLLDVATLDISKLNETNEQKRIRELETENKKLQISQKVMSKTQAVVGDKLKAKLDAKREESE